MEKELILDIVSLNKKGQIIIPAKIRKRFDLKKGSRLLIIGTPTGTLVLMKAKDFMSKLKDLEKSLPKIKLA